MKPQQMGTKTAKVICMKKFLIIFSFFTQLICLISAQNLLTEQDFLAMWEQKSDNPKFQGSFGKIYIINFRGQQYALKEIIVSDLTEAVKEEIQGNEMLFSGIKKLNEKNIFYKNNVDSITKYYGTFKTQDNKTILVFDCAPGVSFDTYLKNLQEEERYSKNTFHDISIIFAKYANLIHLEHEAGTVNRDVKGQNFHVQKQASGFSIKGLDHGTMLSLTAIDNGEQRTKCGIGTPARMAPEISKRNVGKRGYSPAVDVFALGCELLNAYFNFFDKEFFASAWNISNFLENAESFQCLPNWEKFFTKALSENKNLEESVNSCLERLRALSNEQQEFLGNLIKDCCEFNPEHRISAAQLGYLLEVFSRSFEDSIALSYEEEKELALKTHPLRIPETIILMIQNPDTRLNGYIALNLLIQSNDSYKCTKTYLELLKNDDYIEFNSQGRLLSYLVLGDIEEFHRLASALINVVQDLKKTIGFENFPVFEKNKTILMPINVILNLGKADMDFQKQEVYYMALLQKGDDKVLQEWSRKNKNIVKNLIKKSFLEKFPISNTTKTIPLSADMIINLGKINKSFQKQEVYGMALLQKGDEQVLQEWSKKNKSTVKTLSKGVYISDDPNLDPNKTIPMSPQMVLNLGEIDKNFQKQDVYGWALLKLEKEEEFKTWSSANPNNKLLEQDLQWHTIE